MGIFNSLVSLFRPGGAQASREHEEAMRTAFKARCRHFKGLLSANKRALEAMASLEEAMRGERSFNMSFVRAQSTTIVTNVFNMVRHLNSLGNDTHTELFDRLKAIQQRIAELLTPKHADGDAPFVLPLKKAGFSRVYEVGSKMASLGEAFMRLGQNIPDGFVVTATGYRHFLRENKLSEEISRRLQMTDFSSLDSVFAASASLRELIMTSPLPVDLEAMIHAHTEGAADAGTRFAVRSSAIGEDSLEHSFAGQYASELNVRPEHTADAYRKVVASKYSASAMMYRYERGIPDEEVPMCVGFLAMIDAVAGGVAYSVDPLGGSRNVLITSVAGLPKSVVDGTTPADMFTVSREVPPMILKRSIAIKAEKTVNDPSEGVRNVAVPATEASLPSLDDGQALEIARITLGIESFYGVPQDVEWAYDREGRFILLQTRPLAGSETTSHAADRPDGNVLLSGGVCASSGGAAGKVFHVRHDKDMLHFPHGAVLVAEHAHAHLAPVLGRASAVVTDLGGTAGHLASVAREYGIPALFGVTGAFAALEEGREISVDADGRRIYEGILKGLADRKKPRRLFRGSPVYKVLGKVVQHIVPLNLLDPDSPEFTPAHCKTLHDITRYCHEKGVEEMFRFDTDALYCERCGRQLRYKGGKLQYYVVDIDQGFCGPVEGRYVDMEQICCLPMHALWQGMLAVPWELPASTSGRGFLSVVAESATNPELEITHSSMRLTRNYFLVDRDFFNLQASFGYHFCSVEAQAGESPQENYVSFHFKGGAANLGRRKMRVLAIADVLIENGFIVEVKEDTLSARAEDLQQCEAFDLLHILGYLLVHSRQMDAALSGEDSRISFADSLRKGIAQTMKVCGNPCESAPAS